MCNRTELSFRLSAFAAALVAAVGLAGCGGGGAALPEPLVIDLRPPLVPPPPVPPLPPPVPPVDPPADPPAEPPVVPDFSRVRSMAVVAENTAVLQATEEYVGLYVGDEEGDIWRRDESGAWTKFFEVGLFAVEALAYVPDRHALYMTLDGQRLARLGLEPAPAVIDDTQDPPVVLDPGGLRLELLATSRPDDLDILDYAGVTGLAFDPASGRLYCMASAHALLLHFADLDSADQVSDREYAFDSAFPLLNVQELSIDGVTGRLLALDGGDIAEIHLGTLDVVLRIELDLADARAMAGLADGTRLVSDRAQAGILHVDKAGAPVP